MSPIFRATLAFEIVHIWFICRNTAVTALSMSYARRLRQLEIRREDIEALIKSRCEPNLQRHSNNLRHALAHNRGKARKAYWAAYQDYTGKLYNATRKAVNASRRLDTAWGQAEFIVGFYPIKEMSSGNMQNLRSGNS